MAHYQEKYQHSVEALKECAKAHLVAREGTTLLAEIGKSVLELAQRDEFLSKTISSLQERCELDNMLFPSYSFARFKISNYSHLRLTEHYVFTETAELGGLLWRLKVYPNGLTSKFSVSKEQPRKLSMRADECLSIFIELVGGDINSNKKTKQRHKVSLVNHVFQSKEISREFES